MMTEERVLGGYRLQVQLGEGGMGSVFRARQLALDREVALKILRPGALSQDENRARFQREMQIAAGLSHPGLVKVLDGGTADDTGYIAMELVRGKPLVEIIVSWAPFAWPFALAVTARIADALAYLHQHDILHRDIKPSNILVARDGAVKLADFGLARFTNSTVVTEDGAVVGTLQFMAPEVLMGEAATVASELWSVGCVLYVMLTGRMHVEATGSMAFARSVVNDPIRPPGMLAPGLPAEVSNLVLALLEKEPAARPPSASEIATRAEALLDKLDAPAADAILKAGLLDELAVWRALPADVMEEERTVSLPEARRAPVAPAARAPWRAGLIAGLLVLMAVVLVLKPSRKATVVTLPPATSASPASPPSPPAAMPRWHVPARYFETLKRGGPPAQEAADELALRHPVPLGHDPAAWLHAYRLGVWLADGGRPEAPPHLAAVAERTVPPLAFHAVHTQCNDAAKAGPPAFLAFAIRMVSNYPDEPRAWIALGRGLDLDGAEGEARVAYRRGRALLGSDPFGDATEELWNGLGRSLELDPPADLEAKWFLWIGARRAKVYAWGALRAALEKRDPALYERMLARGATDGVSDEGAGYYLGVRQIDVHHAPRVGLETWKRALERVPDSRLLRRELDRYGTPSR